MLRTWPSHGYLFSFLLTHTRGNHFNVWQTSSAARCAKRESVILSCCADALERVWNKTESQHFCDSHMETTTAYPQIWVKTARCLLNHSGWSGGGQRGGAAGLLRQGWFPPGRGWAHPSPITAKFKSSGHPGKTPDPHSQLPGATLRAETLYSYYLNDYKFFQSLHLYPYNVTFQGLVYVLTLGIWVCHMTYFGQEDITKSYWLKKYLHFGAWFLVSFGT